MMGEKEFFRKRFFGGFNREDVIKYIAKIADERNTAIAEKEKAENELISLKEELNKLRENTFISKNEADELDVSEDDVEFDEAESWYSLESSDDVSSASKEEPEEFEEPEEPEEFEEPEEPEELEELEELEEPDELEELEEPEEIKEPEPETEPETEPENVKPPVTKIKVKIHKN